MGKKTYIFPNNRAKTRTPKYTLPTNLVNKQALAAEHCLAEALALVLGHDALRTCQERIFADAPLLVTPELDDSDVTDSSRCEQEFAGPGVGRLGHVAANQGFLEREFHATFEGYGWGHGDHGACGLSDGGTVETIGIEVSRRTWLRSEWASNRQLHSQDSIGVAMAHAIAAAIESAYIVCGCTRWSGTCASKLWLLR